MLIEFPLVVGFPHPAGGFVIVLGAGGGCTDRVDATGAPQPGGAFDIPAFDGAADTFDTGEGFPQPGGAFVTPTFDGAFAFVEGTSLAVYVFTTGAGFGGGAYGLL